MVATFSLGASLVMDESDFSVTNTNGSYNLDASKSRQRGVEVGAYSGEHVWSFTRATNSVNVSGNRSPIQIVAGANVTVNGDEVEKSITGNSWNSSFYSTLAFDPNEEDFAVSWLIESVTGTIREMGGLDDNPAQNNSYTSLNYAMYQVDGYIYSFVYEEGVTKKIPNYTNFYLAVGDRVGIKCVGGLVSYFVLRGSVEVVLYTSETRATLPLYFKGALNRGSGQSGHSSISGVEWHVDKVTTSSAISIRGKAADMVSEEHIVGLSELGLSVANGSTYSNISFSPTNASKFFDGITPYPLKITHGFIVSVSQKTSTLDFE